MTEQELTEIMERFAGTELAFDAARLRSEIGRLNHMLSEMKKWATSKLTLRQVRKEWEKGLAPLAVIGSEENGDREILVILESGLNRREDNKYYCHRYMETFGGWVVSADGQNVRLEAVFSWLNRPCAESTRVIDTPPAVK